MFFGLNLKTPSKDESDAGVPPGELLSDGEAAGLTSGEGPGEGLGVGPRPLGLGVLETEEYRPQLSSELMAQSGYESGKWSEGGGGRLGGGGDGWSGRDGGLSA